MFTWVPARGVHAHELLCQSLRRQRNLISSLWWGHRGRDGCVFQHRLEYIDVARLQSGVDDRMTCRNTGKEHNTDEYIYIYKQSRDERYSEIYACDKYPEIEYT